MMPKQRFYWNVSKNFSRFIFFNFNVGKFKFITDTWLQSFYKKTMIFEKNLRTLGIVFLLKAFTQLWTLLLE